VYYGDSVGAGTIQTKDSVQSMIDSQLQEDEYTFFNYLNVEDADTDCGGTIWYVKAKLCQAGTAVSIIINMGNRGSFMGTGTKICKLPSQFCGTKNVAIPVVSKLLDTPITTGMVYLNSGTGQLTLAQTIPADSVSAEWEGAMVYGID
jgi:hypothetical protein